MSGFGCTSKCWTPIDCPKHGSPLPPYGRSVPLGYDTCGDECRYAPINVRHLWDEHDSDRWYADPQGWTQHERTCGTCSPTGANP